MDYKRPLQASLLDQLSRLVTVIHVIIGPRQVVKTNIARQIQDAIGIPSIYATADSPVPLDAA
jgi:predicted AAA+ superfamily ATPase